MQDILDRITAVDADAKERAEARQNDLTKPKKALGLLEDIGIQVASILGTEFPNLGAATVVVFAADHGVSAENVSAYPASVTPMMVTNFLKGGAAINAISNSVGANVVVVNAGVNADFADAEGFINKPIAKGTRNMKLESAMTPEETEAAMRLGAKVAKDLIASGSDILVAGEMGIGNTSSAAAITARLLRLRAFDVTGHGTGVEYEAYHRKVNTIQEALDRRTSSEKDALETLVDLGGLEIAAMVGFMLEVAAQKRVLIIDGFIAGAAALVAHALKPEVKQYFIASHISQEKGHKLQLDHLGLTPVLHMQMRLGEGTGGALTVPIVRSAAQVLTQMATFGDMGIG